MAESANFLEKYSYPSSGDGSTSIEQYQNILAYSVNWENFDATKKHASVLKELKPTVGVPELKNYFADGKALVACMEALRVKEDTKARQSILTVMYDMLRYDSSCFSFYERALDDRVPVYTTLLGVLREGEGFDVYISDKVAWLLTIVIGHRPSFFSDAEVVDVVQAVFAQKSCSELGKLEAVTNLLKPIMHRKTVWSQQGVGSLIFNVEWDQSAPLVYRCVFGIWMLSFDTDLISNLNDFQPVRKLKTILLHSRVEKVVRLSLTVLRNFLRQKEMSEAIVEEGVLDVVQQLEFEKWRDAELYDDIRDVVQQIASEVKELSNFERYERELQSGQLSWGFIHSSKFWGENVMKFEQNDFRALKTLAERLMDENSNPVTLAVVCHDIGEIVALHPLGKKKVNALGIKDRVMELMGSTDPDLREVRREALLCCQKIMLNKWQEYGSQEKQ